MGELPPSVHRVDVLDVRVGHPSLLATTRRGEVASAIAKHPLDPLRQPSVHLGALNLAGDDQADRSVHGGPDKSVYCYPFEHAAAWSADGFDLEPGSVGENVVVRGATETEVRVGDVWRWGDALVQISQPRAPCFKLSLHTGRRDIAPAMIATGRCGWYLRTLQPGAVPLRGPIDVIESNPASATVAETFAVMFPHARVEADDADTVARVLESAAIAPEWVEYLRARNPLAARHSFEVGDSSA